MNKTNEELEAEVKYCRMVITKLENEISKLQARVASYYWRLEDNKKVTTNV